jgi:hypothetical protein
MSALEQFTQTISNLTQTSLFKARVFANIGVSKAKELAEIARLKLEIATEEDYIRKAYQEIGRLYYAERSLTPDGPYTVLCEKITSSKENIQYNEERIADIFANAGLSEEGFCEDASFESVEPKNTYTIPQTKAPEAREQNSDAGQTEHPSGFYRTEPPQEAPSQPDEEEDTDTDFHLFEDELEEPAAEPEYVESSADLPFNAPSQPVTEDIASSPEEKTPANDSRSHLPYESAEEFRNFLTNSSTAEFCAFLNRDPNIPLPNSEDTAEGSTSRSDSLVT